MKTEIDGATLYPTHSCFDDAAICLGLFLRDNEDQVLGGHYMLCHGIMNIDGLTISHAWIESPEYCYDMKLLNGERVIVRYPLTEFSKDVIECTRYSYAEAIAMDRIHKNCGPWKEEYLRLCNDHEGPEPCISLITTSSRTGIR